MIRATESTDQQPRARGHLGASLLHQLYEEVANMTVASMHSASNSYLALTVRRGRIICGRQTGEMRRFESGRSKGWNAEEKLRNRIEGVVMIVASSLYNYLPSCTLNAAHADADILMPKAIVDPASKLSRCKVTARKVQ